MLRELHLRDLGVIKEVGVELAPGLNVITGETGVGKTLLMTSLSLLTGARGSARLVRDGATEAIVEAVVMPPDALRGLLDERGVDAADELVLVRKLAADGRSRAWVQGQLAPVSTLAEVGDLVIEIHGQGAGFALARPSVQLAAVDALAGNGELLGRFRASLETLRALEAERERLRDDAARRARDREVLTYQVDEIDRAQLAPDEDVSIDAAIARLEHAERLREIGQRAHSLVGAEGAAAELAEANKALHAAVRIDPSIESVVSRLADVAVESADLAREIRSWTESLDADPSELERLRERKVLISDLKRKHGGDIDRILAFGEEARARLEASDLADKMFETIDTDVEAARREVDDLANALSTKRRKAAKLLTKLVRSELPALALPNATFDARVVEADVTRDGADRVEFLFSSSRSHPAHAIEKIASGGELSRAMIAITLAMAYTHDVPVMVFDEADQGIGGEAALELGRRLARLGTSHQVLVVSHLPQIAAFADRHIAIRRSGAEVSVEVLDDESRSIEISRMLAGLESSERARAHAAELLELAASERDPSRARAG